MMFNVSIGKINAEDCTMSYMFLRRTTQRSGGYEFFKGGGGGGQISDNRREALM